MVSPDVYVNLSTDEALDSDARNIHHPRLRDNHERMLPYLRVMNVQHFSFAHPESDELVLRQGQLVVHDGMTDMFRGLFDGLLEYKYPVENMIPISQIPGSEDALSMAANHTIVYRPDVIGDPDDPRAPVSEHARGSALDLNPLDNPLITPDYRIEPPEAIGRLARFETMLLRRPDVIQHALSLGFEWGNDWPDPRFGDGFYGVQNGVPRHILRDQHHLEAIPRIAQELDQPF